MGGCNVTLKTHSLLLVLAGALMLLTQPLFAATTGKIAGKVVDAQTGEPLPGANITIAGTQFGAASDIDGDFFIINVPPGRYSIKATMMGYSAMQIDQVQVSVNSTVNLNFHLRKLLSKDKP